MTPEQRAAQRAPDACPADDVLPAPIQLNPRPDPKCDPPVPPIPEVFVAPAAAPAPVVLPSYVLPVINVPNLEQTAYCPSAPGPTHGAPSVIKGIDSVVDPVPKFVETVALIDIVPVLTDSQGRYLAGIAASMQPAPGVPGWLGLTAEEIAVAGRLQPSQAAWVHAQLEAKQALANSKALTLATSLLDCVWKNTCQEAWCAADALEGGIDCEGVSYASLSIPENPFPYHANPTRVLAGVFSSSISQADADNQALVAAQQALVCVWANRPVDRKCTDEDLGFAETVEGVLTATLDSEPSTAGTPRGRVIVPAGLFFADTQVEADLLALNFANSLLSCFYANEEQFDVCPSVNGVPPVGAAEHLAPGYAVVAAGTVFSLESVADANTQALALATAQLDCYWLNDTKTATCPDRGLDENGTEVYQTSPGVWPSGTTVYPAAAEPLSPVKTATIDAELIVSKISKADANNQAQALADAQLSCRYCNQGKDPLCAMPLAPPPGVITTADIANWIDANGDVLSRDITLGVAPGLYCAESPGPAREIAESLASIPVRNRAGANCSWGNKQIRAQCQREHLEETETIVGPEWPDSVSKSDLAKLSPNSSPDPTNDNAYIYVAKDSVILTQTAIALALGVTPSSALTAAAAQAYVDDQAVLMARAFLNCFWENQRITAYCRATLPANGTDLVYGLVDGAGALPIGNYMPDLASVPDEDSNHTVVVPEKLYTSYTGQADADTVALGIAISQLDCWVKNKAVTAKCTAALSDVTVGGGAYGAYTMPDGESTADSRSKREITVEADKLISYLGYMDANYQATAIAISQLDCWVKNKRVVAKCTSTLADVTRDGNRGGEDYLPDGYTHADPNSRGSNANPVVVEADQVISYLGYIDANTLAMVIAISQVNCWAHCNCEVTATLNFDNLILPLTCQGKNWMLSQASATTLHVRGISNKATASNTFAFGCGHCIFTGHIAKVVVPCDGVGYEATITPATNWAEVGAVTSDPADPTAPRPACPGLGHPVKTAKPCVTAGGSTAITKADGVELDPFVVTTTHNKWYVVVNGKLLKSFNADSPPYDPEAGTLGSC